MKAALRGLTHRFWAVPLLFAVAAAVLALGVTAIDDSLDTSLRLPFLFAGGPEGARALLSAIITSMISFTGLVFSITIVVLQLTSSQFSPRVLRSFLEDRFNQVALGVFVATFVYALMVLRGVRGTAQVDSFVPQIAVTVAFVLVLASVLVFLAYIHHIAQSIRAATVIASIADDTRALIEVRVPADSRPGPVLPLPNGPSRTIAADRPGVLQRVDDRALGDAADSQGVSIELLRAVGEFVAKGAPLALVHGEASFDDGRLHAAVHVGRERSMDEDIGFGLRQLVDIAERTLSPGINDPTTAVQALDQLHDIVRLLATRALPPRQRTTEDGRLVVSVPQPEFADYLELAFDEITHWGGTASAYSVAFRLRCSISRLPLDPNTGQRCWKPSRATKGRRWCGQWTCFHRPTSDFADTTKRPLPAVARRRDRGGDVGVGWASARRRSARSSPLTSSEVPSKRVRKARRGVCACGTDQVRIPGGGTRCRLGRRAEVGSPLTGRRYVSGEAARMSPQFPLAPS